MLSNQDFCYWLQGYFEISEHIRLNPDNISLIKRSLLDINEPLGVFTEWLKHVIEFFELHHYSQNLVDYFTPEIQHRLNSIFFHVIDNSYDVDLSGETLKKIHDGIAI